jgi:hypothetical protein
MTKETAQPAQAEQCNYPDCKCPTENPCLKGLAQPAQEPVEDVVAYHADGTRTVRIALQRPWVGLTDGEISDIAINNPPKMDATRPGANDHLKVRSKGI